MPSPKPRGHLQRTGQAPFRSRGADVPDGQLRRILARLDERSGEPSSTAELVAAMMRLSPDASDADIAHELQVDEPAVAEVRGRLAAGRPVADLGSLAGLSPDTGPETPGGPSVRNGGIPAACGERWPAMPSYRLTAPDGTVSTHPTYRSAMVARARHGGVLTVEAT